MDNRGDDTLGGSRREPAPGAPVGGLRVVRGGVGDAASRQAGGVLDNTTVFPTPDRTPSARATPGQSKTCASKSSLPKCQSSERKRVERRASRWALRDAAQSITTRSRLLHCGRRATKKNPSIRLLTQDGGPRVAHYSNVQLCGLVFLCPVCGPRIRNERATELNEALARWITRHGAGSVALATLTLPHLRNEQLGTLLALVSDGFARLTQGKAWVTLREEFGLVGYVRAHDTTHGVNGWHPHLHIVFLSEKPLSVRAARRLRAKLFDQWCAAVVAVGHRPPNTRACSLEVARNARAVGRYVFQVVAGGDAHDRPIPVALEVTRGDLKTSRKTGQRTPWEILTGATAAVSRTTTSFSSVDRARKGQARDLALWHEWEEATKGVHSVQWSRGLRKLVALDVEKTDEEVVAIEIGGEVVYEFHNRDHWRAVVACPGARLRLLRAAERWGGAGVGRMVRCIAAWFAPVLAQEAAEDRAWRAQMRETVAIRGGYIWMPPRRRRSARRVRRAMHSVLGSELRAEIGRLLAA
jgi:hypothetical protein